MKLGQVSVGAGGGLKEECLPTSMRASDLRIAD